MRGKVGGVDKGSEGGAGADMKGGREMPPPFILPLSAKFQSQNIGLIHPKTKDFREKFLIFRCIGKIIAKFRIKIFRFLPIAHQLNIYTNPLNSILRHGIIITYIKLRRVAMTKLTQKSKRRIIIVVAVILVLVATMNACAANSDKITDTEANRELKMQENKNMNQEQTNTYRQISMEESVIMMREESDYIILDVRRSDEFAEGHIPNAINVANEDIGTDEIVELPDKDQLIMVYCRSGRRSKEAAEKLVKLGYTNIVEFGGILDWTGNVET